MADTLFETHYPPAIYLGTLTVKNLIVGDTIVWPRTTFPIILEEDCVWYRKIIRDDFYCIDCSDDCGSTWNLDVVQLGLDEESPIIQIDSGLEGYRELVRDGLYVIDYELTETGFAGEENTDWENVISISCGVNF